MIDAIYILNARPSKEKDAIEFCRREIANYFKGGNVNFSGSQINIDHCYELVNNEKVFSEKKNKWIPHGRPHIGPLAGRNDVSFSDTEISKYLKEHLSESDVEKRLKEIWDRGRQKITERHKGKITVRTGHLLTKSNCRHMLAGDLGLYNTEKKPTWMIQFLSRNSRRQVDSFARFLDDFEVGDASCLSGYSKLYVETGIANVYKAVELSSR
jgi:hypothetical protein